MKPKTKRSSKGKVSVPLYRWMMFWLLVLTSVALVCALFGQVDVRTLLPANALNDQQKAEDVLITNLRAEVARLQATVRNMESQTASTTECETLMVTPIDTYVTYRDQVLGHVSMSLPYSFGWNGKDCQISPALLYPDNSIGFGPGHIYGRYASMSILSREDAEDILRIEVESAPTSTDQLGAVYNVRRRTINGLAVTSYSHGLDIGFTENVWVAAGRTYTYVIRDRYQWLTDSEAIKIIQSLRVTR